MNESYTLILLHYSIQHRNPKETLGAKVLKSKSPGSNSQEFCMKSSWTELPSRENTIAGEHQGAAAPPEQGSWQGQQGSGLTTKIHSPTVPGQEEQIG